MSASSASSVFLSITGEPLNLDLSDGFLGNCASISAYEKLNSLGEGTYGIVYRARDKRTSAIVALKQIRIQDDERHNGIPLTALREISILRSLKHQNIVNVVDVAVHDTRMDEIYMVMAYSEQDLANLIDELKVEFSLSQVKCLAKQLLEGLEYLHRNDIIHRDVKLQNILLTAKGVLKLADFGMARAHIPRPLTPGVCTIWYRAPELLLGTKYYTPSIDLWSAGLIIGELLLSTPVLPGETAIEELSRIVKLIGTPTSEDLAALSDMGCPDLIKWRRESMPQGRADNLERRFLDASSRQTVKFLSGLLTWDPRARLTASEALGKGKSRSAADAEAWWRESPRAVDRELLPTFPEVRNQRGGDGLPRQMDEEVKASSHGNGKGKGGKEGVEEASGGYVFEFGDADAGVTRPRKRFKR